MDWVNRERYKKISLGIPMDAIRAGKVIAINPHGVDPNVSFRLQQETYAALSGVYAHRNKNYGPPESFEDLFRRIDLIPHELGISSDHAAYEGISKYLQRVTTAIETSVQTGAFLKK